jgi:hypothetical protein
MRVGEAVLVGIVLAGFEPASEVKPQFNEPAAQGVPGNPQPAGGLKLIPAGILEDAG